MKVRCARANAIGDEKAMLGDFKRKNTTRRRITQIQTALYNNLSIIGHSTKTTLIHIPKDLIELEQTLKILSETKIDKLMKSDLKLTA
ncbi:hypothetical protein N665_0188s0149 [Sinapis alba]|nr:hypothetical protein N665_0188s0149 [Sinapis alba]